MTYFVPSRNWIGEDALDTVVTAHALDIEIPPQDTRVSGLFMRPQGAVSLVVLGHGAGAGMTHPFMAGLAEALAQRGVATLRYNFPYKEHGGRRPDREAVLTDTVRAAVDAAQTTAPTLALFLGGKSMGGRMASRAMAQRGIDGVRGLVFFGFPLHAAGKDEIRRAAHLAEIEQPMLFLQGTRDRLAKIGLMRNVVADLGRLATLQIIDNADHSFNMLKRSGRTNSEAIAELAQHASDWIGAQTSGATD